MIALIARGKSLIAPGGARIARCESRQMADLLVLYARSSALLSTLAPCSDPRASVTRASVTLQIAALERALLQTVTLNPPI